MGTAAANLTGNRDMMALIARTDTKAMLWLVGDLARMPELSKSIEVPGGPVTAVVGSEVAYSVHLRNFGGLNATNLNLNVTFPDGL